MMSEESTVKKDLHNPQPFIYIFKYAKLFYIIYEYMHTYVVRALKTCTVEMHGNFRRTIAFRERKKQRSGGTLAISITFLFF